MRSNLVGQKVFTWMINKKFIDSGTGVESNFRETVLYEFDKNETNHIHCECVECCTMSFASWKSYFPTQIEINRYCHGISKSAKSTKNHIQPINPKEIHHAEENAEYHQS